MVEHAHAAELVEKPEHRRIEVLALATGHHSVRIEACERLLLQARIVERVGLKEQRPRADAPNPLERELRVLEMVEDSVEKDQVEGAEPLRLEVVDVHQERARIRLTRGLD